MIAPVSRAKGNLLLHDNIVQVTRVENIEQKWSKGEEKYGQNRCNLRPQILRLE